jgi:hypothetical protein
MSSKSETGTACQVSWSVRANIICYLYINNKWFGLVYGI